MPATATGYSGKYGSVLIGGVEIPAHEWTYTPEVAELDVTNFTSRRGVDAFAQQQVISGVAKGTFAVSVYPTTMAAFSVGDVIALTLNLSPALVVVNGVKARVTDLSRSASVTGAVELTISATTLTSVV